MGPFQFVALGRVLQRSNIVTKRLIQVVSVAILILGLVIPPSSPSSLILRAQPALLDQAAQHPDQYVGVIVQKLTGDGSVEALVGRLGGAVVKDLRLISAFAAQIPARAVTALAQAPGVRWISLDAPARPSALNSADFRVAASSDDAEEEGAASVAHGPGSMDLASSGLQFMQDVPAPSRGVQAIGLRFTGIQVPPGATIASAHLRFNAVAPDAGNNNADPANFTFQAEAADNAATFSASAYNITSRPRTSAAVTWTPAAWTSGALVDSPDLATVVQEVVRRPGWVSGNSLAIIIRCADGVAPIVCGSRTAASWDAGAQVAPVLHVEWDAPPPSGFSVVSAPQPELLPDLQPASISTAWATITGTEMSMGLVNGHNLLDSGLGPNGAYAIGRENTKGSVTGFQSEAAPGNSISRVEVLLHGYVPGPAARDFKLQVWLAGNLVHEYAVHKQLWAAYTKASLAGQVAIDITNVRPWTWADLDSGLAIGLDFTSAGGDKTMDALALDAVGLRVTSLPGDDGAADTGGDPSPVTDIDTTQLGNVYNQVVRSSEVWNAAPRLQGKGVTVAVVDSGVLKTRDLQWRVRANANFNASYHRAADRYGHGTFVAGIIAGNGSHSGSRYIGVAPRADVLNVRVSDDQGAGTESDVVSALQWVWEQKDRYNIRVVNLSLNSSVAQSYHTSPLCAAVEMLWFSGIVVVVSAGNNGTGGLLPPANDPFVITVGATDDQGTPSTADDAVATFSAYGVTEGGNVKPELVAPGRRIVGLLPDNDQLTMSANHSANRVDRSYFRMSGTSVSAPIVSGGVALVLQDEPNLTPNQVKYRLMATAHQNWPGYNPASAGAGYLDVKAAVEADTVESANQAAMPHLLLAKMALIALWSSTNGGEIIDWGSVNWNSVNWNSVDWNSVDWNSVDWNSVNWNSVDWSSVNWNSVNWNSVNWNSVNWNSVNWNSVNWNSVNWNSVNWNSDYWEP